MWLNTGWFSDCTACYLAAGLPCDYSGIRPYSKYGGKEGLLSFSTSVDYQQHSQAATRPIIFGVIVGGAL